MSDEIFKYDNILIPEYQYCINCCVEVDFLVVLSFLAPSVYYKDADKLGKLWILLGFHDSRSTHEVHKRQLRYSYCDSNIYFV